jgi:chlorobactene glucosyltransferase
MTKGRGQSPVVDIKDVSETEARRQPQGLVATRGGEEREPFVSILVPARNEEGCIEACVRSLVGQKYGRLEVLVLDDQSSDGTAMIVQAIIDETSTVQKGRLRLLKGGELPRGWIGKNFACQQLAEQAQGEYLFFTDADTIHDPEMLPTILKYMQQERLQLLTGQPEHILGSPGERLIVPLLNFTILTLLPVALIGRRPEPSLATGNGQLLCFERAAYEKIGGHAAVKDRILEDVLLARKIKSTGHRMAFVDALELVQCRMYHSWHQVWAGFSKNLFAFYNYSLPFALFALVLNLLLFVLPALLLLSAPFLAMPQHIVLYAPIAYTLSVTMRMLLTLRFVRAQKGLMLLYSFLHPVSIVLECLILVNSIRWRYRKSGTTWKGRQYV